MVWRSGGVLHADPHLPACVGVVPLGLELGLVFNHSPGSIQARWETLSVKQDSCLWWRVRGKDTAPNAPNIGVHRDVVRHGGTNAKMTVSTENSHFLVNYSHLD